MKTFEFNSLMARDEIFLLDVRTPLEFRQGFIHGSVNVPLDRLLAGDNWRVPEGKRVCLVCQSGKRAEKARCYLAEQYGTDAEVLEGGVDAWMENGFPVEHEVGVHQFTLIRQVQIVIGLLNITGFMLSWLVSPYWLALPVFTSIGLLMAGLTGFCGLAVFLSRMPWNRTR